MGMRKRKSNLIEERAKALKTQMVSLDAQIRKLSSESRETAAPRLRSTTRPQGSNPAPAPPPSPPPPSAREPIFEEVNQDPLQTPPEPASTPQHYNDLGARKYDLAALFRRARGHLGNKPVTNPKLVYYLAAGSIHGLRPLRYEKRIARNRFIIFSAVLALVLWGLFVLFRGG
jgi:hypothetical protein